MQAQQLLTALMALAALLSPSVGGPCSDHGSLSCKCDYGYTGPNCDVPIDWCAQENPDFAGGRNNSAFCGSHGHCLSSPSDGAHCVCLPGFTGLFCEQPIPGERAIARRCVAYQTNTTRKNNESLCPQGQRCLTDYLNCGFQPCDNPIGWCLPAPKVEHLMAQVQARQAAPAKTVGQFNQANQPRPLFAALSGDLQAAAAATQCDHGKGTCTCDSGYTGPQCGQEVDFCTFVSPRIGGHHQLGDVCGRHGHCQSHPTGLTCACDLGWSGDFCDVPVPSVVTESRRCVPYKTDTSKRLNETILCPDGQRCLSDRLNCGFQKCIYPIGWCVPAPSIDSVPNESKTSRR